MLLAVCQDFNIENEIIPRIASCFGGGIGNTGSVCGAVAGAAMAIGLKMKRDSIEDYFRQAAVMQEFRRRFEAEMGTINCRELTGLDFSEETDVEKLMDSGIAETVCVPAVGVAYKIIADLLKENSE